MNGSIEPSSLVNGDIYIWWNTVWISKVFNHLNIFINLYTIKAYRNIDDVIAHPQSEMHYHLQNSNITKTYSTNMCILAFWSRMIAYHRNQYKYVYTTSCIDIYIYTGDIYMSTNTWHDIPFSNCWSKLFSVLWILIFSSQFFQCLVGIKELIHDGLPWTQISNEAIWLVGQMCSTRYPVPETNIFAPQHGCLGDDPFLFGKAYLQGAC